MDHIFIDHALICFFVELILKFYVAFCLLVLKTCDWGSEV